MEPVDRVRARILTLQTWGRPIKLFKDVPELLTTFRNAIEGIFFECIPRLHIFDLLLYQGMKDSSSVEFFTATSVLVVY